MVHEFAEWWWVTECAFKCVYLVCYLVCMRLHITLDDDLVAELDKHVGPRERSAFIAATLEEALRRKRRLDALDRAFGSISDTGHEWDEDPAAWVAAQRRLDPKRVG